MKYLLAIILLSNLAFAQTPQLTHGTQEIIITVYDPDEGGFSSGVDYVLWGTDPDTYGPPLPMTRPCPQTDPCNVSVEWDTTQFPNGVVTVYAKAWDKRGNQSLAASKPFTVQNDLAPPTIMISAPQQGSTVRGQVQIVANASDDISGVAYMQLWINGTQRAAVNGGSLTYRWNTNPERKSWPISTLEVRATDNAGKQSTRKIQVALN